MDSSWLTAFPGLFLLVLLGGAFALILLSKWIRYIPNNRVGIVEKLISGKLSGAGSFGLESKEAAKAVEEAAYRAVARHRAVTRKRDEPAEDKAA